jgi:hypothetical protein
MTTNQDERLITREQVKDLLTYGYTRGRVWKEPSEGEIMQGFDSLAKPLDYGAVKECLYELINSPLYDAETEQCRLCGERGLKHTKLCTISKAKKLLAQLNTLGETE